MIVDRLEMSVRSEIEGGVRDDFLISSLQNWWTEVPVSELANSGPVPRLYGEDNEFCVRDTESEMLLR